MLILGYIWALPLTLPGLLVGFAFGRFVRLAPDGLYIFEARPWLRRVFFERFGVAGFTWGATLHVAMAIYTHSPAFMKHERRHFWQAQVWGVFQPFAYGIASLVALAQGGEAYRDNYFEVDARKAEEVV